MRRHAFGIAATALTLILFGIALGPRSAAPQAPPRTLDAKTPITYFIADGAGRTGYHSADRELALWALQAWQRSAGNSLQVAAAAESTALIRVYWAEPG